MNIHNLPHLNVIPRDIRERVDRIWISDQNSVIITKSDEVYTIRMNESAIAPSIIKELCGIKIIDVIIGENFFLALDVNGQIYSWGENSAGQLGLGHSATVYTPTIVSTLSDKRVLKVVSGHTSVMAICDNGEVFHWGRDIKTPTKCDKLNSGVSIACNGYYYAVSLSHTCSNDGVSSNDGKYCFYKFFNEKGEKKVRFPQGYVEFENIIEKVVCGYSHVLVLDSEGKVRMAGCGKKSFVQLDFSEKIIDIAATSISRLSAAMTDKKIIFVWNTEDKKEIKPYPTSFVSFQEVFLCLSQPVTSYGVFNLKGSNLGKNTNTDMLESIIKIFDEPDLSDLTVLVEEKKIYVHKAILGARSRYFKTMFRDQQWHENNKNELKIENYSYEMFKNYLQYLYGMEIDINSDNVLNLMAIADQYMDETLDYLITKKVESDMTIPRPIKLLKEIQRLPTSEYEVLCKELNRSIPSKDSSSKS